MEMGVKLKKVMGNTNELISKVALSTRLKGHSKAASEVLFHSIDANDARNLSAPRLEGYMERTKNVSPIMKKERGNPYLPKISSTRNTQPLLTPLKDEKRY